MGVTVTPPVAANLADNPKNRLYRATQSGTYSVSIPAGVYEVTRQATTNIIIGTTTLVPSTAMQVLFINEPQTSITFNSTNSAETVPWSEGPIQNNGSSQQYWFDPDFFPQHQLYYTPTGLVQNFFTSTDGITWTARTRPSNQSSSNVGGRGVAKGPAASDPYVQCFWHPSTNGASYTSHSTDGIVWSTNANRIFGQSGEGATGIAYGAGRYVVVGSVINPTVNRGAWLSSSTDGITWGNQQYLIAPEGFTSIDFGNGVFVVGGEQGSVRTSTDGLTWTARQAFFGGNRISFIRFANGRFLATGGNSTARTSTDGITWTTVMTGMAPTADINHSAYDTVNGVWAITSTSDQTLRASTNLVTWVARSLPIAIDDRGMTYGGGQFIVAATDTQARTRFFRTPNVLTMLPSVPFTDTYIILEYKGTTRVLS